MSIEATKECTKCHTILAINSFGKLSRNSDGLQHWCKECCAAHQLKWRSNHREELNAKQSARYRANPQICNSWRKRNSDKVLARRRELYATNPEIGRMRSRNWASANPEKRRTSATTWFLANKNIAHASCKAWREKHLDELREKHRAWHMNNPEQTRALRTAGHAKRKQRLSVVICERIDPFEIFERDKWKCCLCKVKTPRELRGTSEPNAPVIDHIIPLALGGPHTRANLRCLCYKCNATKAAKYEGQLAFM